MSSEPNNNTISPPSASLEKSFEKIVTPFQNFIREQKVTSGILLGSTILAMVLANSPWSVHYHHFLETKAGFNLGQYAIEMSIHHWINDGLMSLFFFVIGLEIKREIMVGELSNPGRTLPVIMAAFGGMVLPATIFTLFNYEAVTVHGWGIPMATDTAFVIGVLAMLRQYIPVGLVAFITALAIIDDIGAIIVIALFYTSDINLFALFYGALILLMMTVLNLLGVRRPVSYILLGGLLWLAMLESGVHATMAGILAAIAVPARPRKSPIWFVHTIGSLLKSFERKEKSKSSPRSILADVDQHQIVEKIHSVADEASTPLQRWENTLEQPVALFVLPIFAFANAGIPINMSLFDQLIAPLSLGIAFGLVLGKVLGISVMTWLVLHFQFGTLAKGVNMPHVVGVGLLAGMGFTMSIFIANLAFSASIDNLVTAKAAILFSSFIAGIGGFIWLRFFSSNE